MSYLKAIVTCLVELLFCVCKKWVAIGWGELKFIIPTYVCNYFSWLAFPSLWLKVKRGDMLYDLRILVLLKLFSGKKCPFILLSVHIILWPKHIFKVVFYFPFLKYFYSTKYALYTCVAESTSTSFHFLWNPKVNNFGRFFDHFH